MTLTKVNITFTCSIMHEISEEELIRKLQILPLHLTTGGVTGNGIQSFEHKILPEIKIIK